MNLLYGENERVARFVASLIPRCAERGFSENRAIGVTDNGTLVGGIVYHNWDPDSGVIELSAASTSRKWLTRPVLYGLFSYPFIGIGCQMVCNRTSEHNPHLLRIMRAYGFSEYRIPRLLGRNEAAHFFTLTEEQWRANKFHKENGNGQKFTSAAS